jgi:hypothetical protein
MVKLLQSLNGEKFQILCFVLSAFIWLFYFGCESKVQSSLDPSAKVNRAQLEKEVELYLAKIDERFATLDLQDHIRKTISDNMAIVAGGGTFNGLGILASLFSVFGVGAAIDNLRYRKKVKELNKNASDTESGRVIEFPGT